MLLQSGLLQCSIEVKRNDYVAALQDQREWVATAFIDDKTSQSLHAKVVEAGDMYLSKPARSIHCAVKVVIQLL